MKSIKFKLNAIAITMMAAGTFSFLAPQISMAGEMQQAGQGWDVFRSGGAEGTVPVPAYDERAFMGTSMQPAPGLGWDVFQSGGVEGTVPVPTHNDRAYMGTSMKAGSGEGWDVFRSGIGDPL